MRCSLFLSVCVSTLVASAASGDLVNPDVPSWRGDALTTYAEFDTFTSAVNGPNFADVGGGGFQLFNFAPGAIIASSGNIYSPAGALNIHLYSLGPVANPAEAVLNVSWGGTMLDTGDVQAFIGGEYYDAVNVEQRDSAASPFGGTTDTWAFTFDLSAFSGVDSLAFFFGNDGAHGSLDAVSIDVRSVPAPGALVLASLAGVLGVRGRRRA